MKVFASDYDGTLRTGEFVTQENKDAIARWRKAGNLFVLVSGRSMESMQKELLNNELNVDLLIGNNGGAIYTPAFTEIKSYYLPFEQALQILAYIKKERTISYVLNNGYHRSKTILDLHREDKKYAHTQMKYTEEEILAQKKIAQIVVSLDDPTDCERIATHINDAFHGVAVAYQNVNCVDIAPDGVSKAMGLKEALKGYDVDNGEIYTIGDSYNDQSMIAAFYGFAMEQAPDEVKKDAKKIVATPAEAINWILNQSEK